MPARRRESAEQRFAAFILVEMKTLRIELCRESLDRLGGEGKRSQFAPLPNLDVLEEPHQPTCPNASSGRRSTMIGEIISHNSCPAALRITHLNVTMPVEGRLRETRASVISTSSMRSSSGRSGASQRNSLTPGEPIDAVRPIYPSNIIRIMIEHRCQPEPERPFSIDRDAASSSRCIGCGSNSAANASISSRVTRRGPKVPKWPGGKSSKVSVILVGDCLRGIRIVASICGNLNPPTRIARALWANTFFRAVLILPGTKFAARPCALSTSLDATDIRFCWGERSMFEFRDLFQWDRFITPTI